MLPEIKILAYITFSISLFFIHSLALFAGIAFGILVLFMRIPFRRLTQGWVPILLFLSFTFIGNMLFQQGKIVALAGPFVITEEGLRVAAERTMRVFLLIAGAKLLTASTDTETLLNAMARLLRPLERFRIPVSEFFSTMGMTMRFLPELKEQIVSGYRQEMQGRKVKGFRERVRLLSSFLVPLFVKNMQAPERFPEKKEKNEKIS
ncbi:MAG: energy-coupling factor transporter transmembrane component T [Nitrospirota bacterium]